MTTGDERARRTRSQRLDEILRGVRALTDASKRRHRLARGTPEYAAALETEERLADRVWDLGSAFDIEAEASGRSGTDTSHAPSAHRPARGATIKRRAG